uniref:Gap junction protein n=1 Tax=Periophthalmus magnuspinnatus TaxID=409849 RepID=A0A3B4AD09_9GOBI
MGDWSILGRFLSEVQNHSTVIGKIWLTMLLIFRILLVALVGDAVYSDEQSKFTCNTQQPGCNNVCYDTFAPVSHLRFWVFQIVLVSTPSIFYIVYVLHKIAKDEKMNGHRTHETAEERAQSCGQVERLVNAIPLIPSKAISAPLTMNVLLIYILHVLLRSVMEITFLIGQYFLFGFEVPHLFRCETYPCPTRTDCFVSRATEKTIFLNFMFSISLGCFVLNVAELHYLGWVYIFRVLCSACSTCCCQERDEVRIYTHHNPLTLQLKHSLRGQLVLQTPALVPDKSMLTHTPAISFQTDSTVEYTSKRSPERRDNVKVKLSNVARTGRTKKSWL